MATTYRWSLVVPVKRPEFAKSRLADAAGPLRPQLARAFAADTVTAALAAAHVEDVTVVTDDDETARSVKVLGAFVVADTPDAGLNAALRHGVRSIAARQPAAPVAALSADLAALRPDELDRVLEAASQHQVSFVADAAGIGTTLYAAVANTAFEPRFGGRSRAAHRQAGAVELDLADIPSVRRDIDTAVDLWDAIRLGLGPRSASVAAQLDLVP